MPGKLIEKTQLQLKTDESVKQHIRPLIRRMKAYPVANAGGLLKLDAMESPYQWPEALKQQWLAELVDVEINRYPEPDAPALDAQLRVTMSIADHHALLFGNGSDELIQVLAMAVSANDRTLMTTDPGFIMFEVIASYVHMGFATIPLQSNFDIDLDKALAVIETQKPSLIFLPRPNNPTGNVFSESKVRSIIEHTEAIVVIDEAYSAFTDGDALHLLDEYPNVLVMRTLSKVGLAGLRLGVLIGSPLWIDEINKVRLPYNINVLTQKSAEFALRHYDVLKEQSDTIRLNRDLLFEQLQALDKVRVWPSEANFLLFRCDEETAEKIVEGLRDRGILIKSMHGKHVSLAQCLRVTVVERDNNERFLLALKELLA